MPSIYKHTINTVDTYREEAIEIARDLGYPNEIFEKIENAKTEEAISRVLTDARNSDKREFKRSA